MTDPNVAETTDEYGRRVTVGPDGSRTVQLDEYTIEGDPNAGGFGGQSSTGSPTSFPGDADQQSQSHSNPEPPEDSLSEVPGEAGHWAANKGLEYGIEKATGLETPFGVLDVLTMDRDTPQSPETQAIEAEARRRDAEWAANHPGMDDAPDASAPDATLP